MNKENKEIRRVVPLKGVPYNSSFLKFFDHFFIKVIMKNENEFTQEEINSALDFIKSVFTLTDIPSMKIQGVKSLCYTIAWGFRRERLETRFNHIKSELIQYGTVWKAFHTFAFNSLFDSNFNALILGDKSYLPNILFNNTTLNFTLSKEQVEEVFTIQIVIVELFQLFQDFLQETFLYIRKYDKDAALSFANLHIEKTFEGEGFRDLNFTPLKLWNIIEKLDFFSKRLFNIAIIIEKDSVYERYRHALAHSNIIPYKDRNNNVSILEGEIKLLSRVANRRLSKNIDKIKIIDDDIGKITNELMCWVGLLIQLYSIFGQWNRIPP